MKNSFGVGVLAVVFSVSIAHATDLGGRIYSKAPITASSTPYDWSGFYLGGHAGYDWGRARVLDNGVLTESSVPMDGAIGGLLAGINWQHDMLVLGIEADLGISALRGHGTVPIITVVPNQYDVNLSGDVRARVGFLATPRTMLFAAAGVAMANFEFRENSGPNAVKLVLTGLTVGGGVDQAFSKNLIGRLEYLYTDYGNRNFGVSPADIYNISFRAQTIRGALILKF